MKPILLTIAFIILTLGSTANAQYSAKLFDPVAISHSQSGVEWSLESAVSFRTAEVYLTCPVNGAEATLSGPNGGGLIVDNFLTLNGVNVHAASWDLFNGVFISPWEMIGQPVETSYYPVAPIDISARLTGTGVYRFDLMDYGDLLGSSAVYLNTNCSLDSTAQVCHRNNGRAGNRTLTIGESAVAAHLAHGDTLGPCGTGN